MQFEMRLFLLTNVRREILDKNRSQLKKFSKFEIELLHITNRAFVNCFS
jgi:hypothetical protein